MGPDEAKRERYALLIGQGYSNSAACRVLQINRRTGTRWRYGQWERGQHGVVHKYPAVITKTRTAPLSERYLSEDERVVIADRRRAGATVRAIAAELGRSASTVSRELRRNAEPDNGRYYPFRAQRLAVAHSSSARAGQAAA